jgi:hypothetical protein
LAQTHGAQASLSVLEAHIAETFPPMGLGAGVKQGVVYVAVGHAVKGWEFDTVYILEPANVLLDKVIARGGEWERDERNLYHVMITRGRDWLILLQNVFDEHGMAGFARLLKGNI